jgi:hypothetical protein
MLKLFINSNSPSSPLSVIIECSVAGIDLPKIVILYNSLINFDATTVSEPSKLI